MSANPLQLPDDIPDGNPHYIQAVTELGDEQEVKAQDDIYASNGMKLVAKGTRVNRDLYERLTRHKLKAPLDFQLGAEHQIDSAELAVEAGKLLEEDSLLERLASRSGDLLSVKHGFAQMKLLKPLNFRLTVMRARRKELFRHSLRCGLISHAFAIHLKLSLADQESLLLAAMCHDLGEMHTDPALLAPERRILPDEQRYVRVHPITGYVLLRDLTAPPVDCMNAVLQHHERLDGSGYPYGLSANKISRLGRLLAVVEVAETMLRRYDPRRLDILLKLNHARFDSQVVSALRDLMHNEFKETDAPLIEDNYLNKLDQIGEMLHAWSGFSDFFEKESAEHDDAQEALAFLFTRMREFRSVMLQAGIDADDVESILNMVREDTELLNEMQATLDELVWRMNEIANEIEAKALRLNDSTQIALSNFIAALRPHQRRDNPR